MPTREDAKLLAAECVCARLMHVEAHGIALCNDLAVLHNDDAPGSSAVGLPSKPAVDNGIKRFLLLFRQTAGRFLISQ